MDGDFHLQYWSARKQDIVRRQKINLKKFSSQQKTLGLYLVYFMQFH